MSSSCVRDPVLGSPEVFRRHAQRSMCVRVTVASVRRSSILKDHMSLLSCFIHDHVNPCIMISCVRVFMRLFEILSGENVPPPALPLPAPGSRITPQPHNTLTRYHVVFKYIIHPHTVKSPHAAKSVLSPGADTRQTAHARHTPRLSESTEAFSVPPHGERERALTHMAATSPAPALHRRA